MALETDADVTPETAQREGELGGFKFQIAGGGAEERGSGRVGREVARFCAKQEQRCSEDGPEARALGLIGAALAPLSSHLQAAVAVPFDFNARRRFVGDGHLQASSSRSQEKEEAHDDFVGVIIIWRVWVYKYWKFAGITVSRCQVE